MVNRDARLKVFNQFLSFDIDCLSDNHLLMSQGELLKEPYPTLPHSL